MIYSTEVFAIDTGCHETFKMWRNIQKKNIAMSNINNTSGLRGSNRSANGSEHPPDFKDLCVPPSVSTHVLAHTSASI